MPFEAKAAEPFDPRLLNTYDAGRTGITWHVDIEKDSRFKLPEFGEDEARFPRLHGIMGTVNLLRKAQAEPAAPHVRASLVSPRETARPSAFGMALAYGPEIAATIAAGLSALVSPPGKKLRNAGLALVGMESAGRGLIACGPTPTEIAPLPSAIEMINTEGKSIRLVNRNGATFDGSLTGADCTPLTGASYNKLEVFYDLQKGANTAEKTWQFCTANLNLKGGGVLPDAAGKVGVFVDTAANVSYVLMGENQPGAAEPYGSLAVLKDGKLDLTNAARYEMVTQSDGSQKIQVAGTLADGAEGPYTLSVRVPTSVEKPVELSPYVMGFVLPLLQPMAPDFATQTPPAPATETAAPTPTETGPKEGDTKIVVENGKNVVYTYKEIKSADNKEALYTGWFRTLTPTRLPVWDWTTYIPDGTGGWKFGKDVGPIQIWVAEGGTGAEMMQSLTHIQAPDGEGNNIEYMKSLRPLVSKRFNGVYPDALSEEQWRQFQLDLQDGKSDTGSITFTMDGKDYQWSPGPNVGTVVYIMNWDDAVPAEGNGFGEWVDNTNTDRFRTAFWGVDDKGNILGAISSQKPLNELTDKQIRAMALFHTISILDGQDMTNRGYSSVLNDYADTSGQDSVPYIQINKNE